MKLVLKNKLVISLIFLLTFSSCSIIKFPFKAVKKVSKSSAIKKNKSVQLERFLKNMSSEERKKWYIKTYSSIATEQMRKYKIPASIIFGLLILKSFTNAEYKFSILFVIIILFLKYLWVHHLMK